VCEGHERTMSGSIAPPILNLSTRRGQRSAWRPDYLPLGKDPSGPTEIGGWVHSQSNKDPQGTASGSRLPVRRIVAVVWFVDG